MNKIIKILLILILLMVCIILTGVMIFFMKNDFRNVNMELIDSYETSISEVEKFDFDLNSTDIEIKESNNDKILVEYYSNIDTDVKIENKDKNIIVDETKSKDNNFKFVFFGVNKKIVIYVPESFEGEFDLKGKSGDIKSEIDLPNNKVNISLQSGDILLKNTNEIDVSTSSGDIKIYGINKKANISSSSGDIDIDKLKIDEKSNITSSSGDINIDTLEIKQNSNITSTSGDVTIKRNQSNCYIETKTSSGDVEVNKNDRKSDIILKIKTTSGDIKVD